MNAQEIIAHWEELCAAADDPGISDAEWRRRNEAAYAFSVTTPRHARLIREEYMRQFPDGPPAGTPGVPDAMRQRIVDFIRQWKQMS